METTGKSELLREMLRGQTDPATIFDQVMFEYRTSGEQAKLELVMALAVELSAYRVVAATRKPP